MALDIKALRSETVGCTRVIHFNNAGASLMPDVVWNEVTEYIQQEALWGGYETAQRRKKNLDEVYQSVASLINAEPAEIAILENATMAWNTVFSAISFKDGDRILTSASEYASNYIAYLHLKKKIDVSIEVIPNDSFGQTSVEALEEMMDEQVRLISITHIPTNSGLVNPAVEIGEVAAKYDCLYLLDACQSVGQFPVDVKKIGCHMLSATGRKYLRGPRGTGFLYVDSDKLSELTPPFPDLHSAKWTGLQSYSIRNDARRFENWESNCAGIVGLNAAVRYATRVGMEAIWERIQHLANMLRQELEKIAHITVHDIGEVKCGIVTFTHSTLPAEKVKKHLSGKSINVSLSSKSSTLVDMTNRGLDKVVRASVHYFNTEKEIGILAKTLDSMDKRI